MVTFEKITSAHADFRDVQQLLAEAQAGLERENKDLIVARYYADGVEATSRNMS